jgi:hypothetical protein
VETAKVYSLGKAKTNVGLRYNCDPWAARWKEKENYKYILFKFLNST